MLALTTSFQSLIQECENRGIPKKDILYAISIEGIKESIADQKVEKEASRAKTRAQR